MPGGIDTTKRKPRRLRGTPALRYINIRSFIVLAGCTLLGALMTQAPGAKRFVATNFSEEALAKEAKEQRERSMLFMESIAPVPQRSAEDIQKVIDHKAKYDFEL